MDIKEVAAYHRKRAQQVHEAGIVNASGNHLAMAEACERFTWRPIDDCPLGTEVLLVTERGDMAVGTMYLSTIGKRYWEDSHGDCFMEPTHFMFLPADPKP